MDLNEFSSVFLKKCIILSFSPPDISKQPQTSLESLKGQIEGLK